jgi:PAS domain S-box-containing protein
MNSSPPIFRYMPLLVLAAAMVVTYFSWNSAQSDSVLSLQHNFEYRALDVADRLDERLLGYEQVLVGVQALFSDTAKMNVADFHSYVGALGLERTFPGFHSLMFAKTAAPSRLGLHNAVHVEQLASRDQHGLTYDVLRYATVRSAIEQAIDTGKIAVTGKLRAASQEHGRQQSGFVMVLPVYKPRAKIDTPDARHSACIGWIAGTFILDDLMAGIRHESASDLDIEIFYGSELSDSAMIYDTDFSRADTKHSKPWFKSVHQVDVSGYPWTLEITSLPGFEARLDRSKPLLIAGTGAGISLLLSMLVLVLVRGRANALHYAARLDASQTTLHAILDNSPIGIWYSGTDGRYRFVNKEFCTAFGMSEQELLNRRPSEIFGTEEGKNLAKTSQFCLDDGPAQLSRETITFADGKLHLLEITRVMLVDENGTDVGTIGIMNDITEAAALQEAVKKSRDELELRVRERTRDLEATAQQLEQEMQERKKLERNIIEVSEESQAQIGRELHDDLGQLLSGAAYLAGSLASRLANTDRAASRQAENIKKIAQDAVKRARYITHGLIPFNIASRGLKQGLEQFAEDVVLVSGIPCEVEFSGTAEVTNLMIATNLYRIAQEAINNAVKHSSATHLAIKLHSDADQIIMTILDDGVGLPGDHGEKSVGMGLLNMNYRAQLIGATISMEANEGKGTRISVMLPIAK